MANTIENLRMLMRKEILNWHLLGAHCRTIYKDKEQMLDHTFIIKRWIVLLLSDKEQQLLSKPLPRKNIMVQDDAATKLLKHDRAAAQTKVSKYWARLLNYAFPDQPPLK